MTLPLPLSELRRGYLDALANGDQVVSWVGRYTITWAVREGYVAQLTERSSDGHKLTTAGETLLALDREHRLDTGRVQLGMTPIAPSRPLYGTTARCACGWKTRSNEAPAKGGKTRVIQSFREHMGVVAANRDLA
jgi:hypothetical protein